jgi:hypothetical protein
LEPADNCYPWAAKRTNIPGESNVTKELSQLEKTLEQSKKQFVTSATRVTSELDRRRKALRRDLERANMRAHKSR